MPLYLELMQPESALEPDIIGKTAWIAGMKKILEMQCCDLLHSQARAYQVCNGTTATQHAKLFEFYKG